MPVWFQKVALAFTIGVLVLVIALPVFHIVGNPSKQDTVAQMYVSMFPQVGENNAEALLDSFITAPDGSLTLLPAKDISVRGYLIGTTVRIIYLGGRDDALLSSIGIFIHRSGGQVLEQMHPKPELDEQYTFTNLGNPGPDEILVLGIFTDQSQQVLLTTSV